MPGNDYGKGNVAFVEQPPAVEQESLAPGRFERRRRLRGIILREQNDGTRNKKECAT